MHVPYSMDDSEPDLYGSLGGHNDSDDYYTQTKWESEDRASAYTNVRLEHVACTKFYTQEDMDKVIRASITNARNAYDDGYKEGYDDGHAEGNYNCQHR